MYYNFFHRAKKCHFPHLNLVIRSPPVNYTTPQHLFRENSDSPRVTASLYATIPTHHIGEGSGNYRVSKSTISPIGLQSGQSMSGASIVHCLVSVVRRLCITLPHFPFHETREFFFCILMQQWMHRN
jgi:hypothetical protein